MANTYYVGNEVTCTANFTVAGTLTDPTTITARVQAPDGTQTSYVYGIDAAVVKVGVGIYVINLTPGEAGTYTYRFEGTGTATSAIEQTFNVRSSVFYS